MIKDKDLKKLNTFQVQWEALFYEKIKSEKDILKVLSKFSVDEIDIFVLGGGSNILPTKKFCGLVLKNEILGFEKTKETKNNFYIKIGSGEDWNKTLKKIVSESYFGMENLALIPGTVGGAVVQNIGAYDVQINNFIHSVEAFDFKTNKMVNFKNRDCCFEYRNSIFKNNKRYFVTSVTLKLNKVSKPVLTYKPLVELENDKKLDAKKVFNKVVSIRRSKLPNLKETGTAGSFFKNPKLSKVRLDKLRTKFPDVPVFQNYGSKKYTVPAGWLIENSSLDKKLMKKFLYEKHKLILVNTYIEKTPKDYGKKINEFSEEVINTVYKDFGIKLGKEVLVI